MNWGYLLDYNKKMDIDIRHKGIENVYYFLPKNENEYISLLERFKDKNIYNFENQRDYEEYIYFISFQHWFIKVFDPIKLTETSVFEIIFSIQNITEKYLIEIDQNFNKVNDEEKNIYLKKLQHTLNDLYNELKKDITSHN